MSDSDVIAETATHRLLIVADHDAPAPDSAGSAFVFTVSAWDGAASLEHADYGQTAPDVAHALEQMAGDLERFGRYLRMFHDVVSFDYITPHGGTNFVAFTTRELARSWGFTDPDAESVRDIVTRSASAALEEWRAYAEGDVWGYVVEERQTWRNQATGETREEWGHVDSCFGFYGSQYAEEEARVVFRRYTKGGQS